jgi:hypothetical protein
MAGAACALGLTVYLYLPLAAAGDPPVNWGDPTSPLRFWDVVSAQVYRPLVFGVSLTVIPGRVAAWGSELVRQFGGGPWGALIALLGLWRLDKRDHLWWRFTLLIAVAFSIYAIGYDTADSYLYLIPAWTAMAFWLAEGLSWLAHVAVEGAVTESRPGEGRTESGRMLPSILLGLLLLSLPLASVFRHGATIDARHDLRAQVFLDAALSEAEPEAVILVEDDERTFALWYGIYGLHSRPDLTPVNIRLYAFPWYRRTLASHHPHVLPLSSVDSEDVDAFIEDVASRLPVYRAGNIGVDTSGLVEEPVGVLVKMTPQ